MINKMKKTYKEYPKPFWVMMLGMFVDQLGGNIMFPFFTLYITAKFNVGLTEVGLMLGSMTAGGIIGGLVGGELADRMGRKKIMLFGLLTSGLFSLVVIFVKSFELLFMVGVMAGLLGSVSGPAYQATLVDVLHEDKRASGFAVMRIIFNVTVALGPIIGGFISDYSYDWLFIGDAIASSIAFLILLKLLPETRPAEIKEDKKDTKKESFLQKGYLRVLKDREYLVLLGFMMLTFAVMMQMFSTLAVFMRDVGGFPNKYYGYIISLNAIMVVGMQFWVSRKTDKWPSLIAMMIGAAFSTLGYFLFGFAKGILFFGVSMAILTVGEMILAPISQSVAAKFSPPDLRGRYMAVNRFAMSMSNIATPYLAGLVIDNYDPRWIWYVCGIVGSIAVAGYYFLHLKSKKRLSDEEPAPVQAEI